MSLCPQTFVNFSAVFVSLMALRLSQWTKTPFGLVFFTFRSILLYRFCLTANILSEYVQLTSLFIFLLSSTGFPILLLIHSLCCLYSLIHSLCFLPKVSSLQSLQKYLKFPGPFVCYSHPWCPACSPQALQTCLSIVM